MFKNKHVIIAMLVAPVLALIAYFATDFVVSEKPHAAKPGETYKLVANPNCRYESGKCTLKNGELRLDVRGEQVNDDLWSFTLTSNQLLKAAAIIIASPDDTDSVPQQMILVDTDVADDDDIEQTWQIELPQFNKENDKLRVALAAGESFYYAETEAIFPEFKTIFQK